MTLIRRVLQLRAAATELSAARAAAPVRVARLSTRARAPPLSASHGPRSALVARRQAALGRSPLSTLAAASAEAAVETLKALCNMLRNDLRAAPPEAALVASWDEQVGQLVRARPGDAALAEELRRAYESGVAIATKQRQFGLAQALVAQMQHHGVAPTAATFSFLVRGAALELLARPESSVEELRELAARAGAAWERELLAVARLEERPLYRKTPKERARFRERLIERVEAQLNAYERALGDAPRSPAPFNEALRTYADNGVPFAQMLKLMVQRALLPDADTYAALLQGARWAEIPATVSQLLQSPVVDELSAPAADGAAAERQSHYVHLLWANAMKAVLLSFAERFAARSARADEQGLDELQKILLFVDKQLGHAFPKFQFASREHHDEVFALRAKAAATCGLRATTLQVLDEYVARAPPGSDEPLRKSVFLCALELFTWSQLEILNLSREQVLSRARRRDVSSSRRVAELERVYKRVLKRSEKKQQQQQHKQKQKQYREHHADEADPEPVVNAEAVSRLSRDAVELGHRLELARELKSYQVLAQERFEHADEAVAAVLDKLAAATGADASASDLDVALKLMEQLMTCATRYKERLGERRHDVEPQVMRRVYRVIKEATAAREPGELSPEERDKLQELFVRALRAAVLFWRAEDVNKLLRKKRRVLGAAERDARVFDLLIFHRVTMRDIPGAYALLEEMHNAGEAPSKDAVHRIVLGVLHKLVKYPDERASNDSNRRRDDHGEPERQDEGEGGEERTAEPKDLEAEVRDALDRSDASAIEDELELGADLEFDDEPLEDAPLLTRMTGADAPASAADVVSFLQDWYNLHRVRPAAKTVVPVLARLLATHDMFEFRRLLQVLDAMDGGLTPATTVWLEKRLALIDRSIDDFRLRRAAR